MKISLSGKKFIISVSVVCILNAAVFGVWFFVYSKVEEKNKIQAEIKKEIELKLKKESGANSLESFLMEVAEDKEKIDLAFIRQENIISLIEELEELARNSNIGLEFRTVEVSSKENVPVLQFKAEGFFEDLYKYLILLENIKYQIAFDGVYLSRENKLSVEDSSLPVWSANFNVRVVSFDSSK